MATMIIPVFLMLLGALVYVFSNQPKFSELGRLLFAAGSFAVALQLSGRSISL